MADGPRVNRSREATAREMVVVVLVVGWNSESVGITSGCCRYCLLDSLCNTGTSSEINLQGETINLKEEHLLMAAEGKQKMMMGQESLLVQWRRGSFEIIGKYYIEPLS